MKKLFSAVLAGVVLSALATSVAASDIGACKGEVPKIDSGIITVDGKMDDAYAQSLKVDINSLLVGTDTGTFGEAYMLWADGSYYLYVSVTDPDTQIPGDGVQESTPWLTDSVEMFFDFGNEAAGDIHQFRVDFSGFPSYYMNQSGDVAAYGPEAAAPYFDEYAVQMTGKGYDIEMRVNLEKYSIKEGDSIGLQLQINDMTAADSTNTTAVYNMAASLSPASWDAASYDYITLGAPLVIEAPEADAPAEDGNAPATADAGLAAAAVLMAAAAGVVLNRKH